MSRLIEKISKLADIDGNDEYRISLSVDDYVITVYDKDNLVGFKLEGDVNGLKIYIVQDTDNYDRNNPKYKEMYEQVELNTLHVMNMLLRHKIKTEQIFKRTLFKKKHDLNVIIPDAHGKNISYGRLNVNTIESFV